ncbi:MAG: ABC transporter permease subunit [Verrucomicrobiaceae bacterium]|nr:MAG: ABC transporter permease subunit [Verrucomicrobiaceae bacterium]
MRLLGIFTILLGALAATGEIMKLALPTARWFFDVSRNVPVLGGGDFPWFGWLCVALLCGWGFTTVVRSFTAGPPNPVTVRRIRRFREIRRGYFSLLILLTLGGVAMLDQAVVGKRALAVRHDGKWTFPAFLQSDLKNKDFGVTDATADAPADYRKLKRLWKDDKANRVIMPLVPYDPTGDTLQPRSRELLQREGVYHENGSRKPYYGLVAKYHDVAEAKMHLRYTMRNGLLNGPADGWDAAGMQVYRAEYKDGQLASDAYSGTDSKEAFLSLPSSDLRAVKYHPAPPIPEEGNWLGTTSQGYDVVAYLYGGLQVNFKAALIYLPVVYTIGIIIGMLMGYFGGWFDLVMDRIIEIFSNMPFLFVVIIFSSMVPDRYKGLPIILTILIIFGWIGITALMRTAAYRDKNRDYISAAKVLGASTPRILLRHLLPNTVAIIVTLVPFTMSGLIFALTSLDYLGFGLPPEYATWGRLLNDGLSNLSAPWLVTSTFIVLVGLLVLITFIGEAVREAFDPKKFTYYR